MKRVILISFAVTIITVAWLEAQETAQNSRKQRTELAASTNRLAELLADYAGGKLDKQPHHLKERFIVFFRIANIQILKEKPYIILLKNLIQLLSGRRNYKNLHYSGRRKIGAL